MHEHHDWASIGCAARTGAPSHGQRTTHRGRAWPQWTVTWDSLPGTNVAALVPAPCPGAHPGHRGEWAPPKITHPRRRPGLAPAAPRTARQNANSCKDSVRRGGNFLHGKYPPVELVRLRPHTSRGTSTDHEGRLACASADVGSHRGRAGRPCPDGADRPQGGGNLLLYAPTAGATTLTSRRRTSPRGSRRRPSPRHTPRCGVGPSRQDNPTRAGRPGGGENPIPQAFAVPTCAVNDRPGRRDRPLWTVTPLTAFA
jgi:hypothetical protein